MHPTPSDAAHCSRVPVDSARECPLLCNPPDAPHEGRRHSDRETCRGRNISAEVLPDGVWRMDAQAELAAPDSRREKANGAPNDSATSAQLDETDTVCGCSP